MLRQELSQGFTFLELLISLALFSILISLGSMALRSFFVREELRHAEHSLQDLIEYARAEALIRGKPVELCVSEDGQSCQKLKSQQEWRGALLVISEGRILQLKSALSSTLHLYWSAGFAPDTSLSFDASGASGAEQGSFYICPEQPYRYMAEALVVLHSGRLRVTNDYSKLAAQCSG